jgi:hypothetical protein
MLQRIDQFFTKDFEDFEVQHSFEDGGKKKKPRFGDPAMNRVIQAQVVNLQPDVSIPLGKQEAEQEVGDVQMESENNENFIVVAPLFQTLKVAKHCKNGVFSRFSMRISLKI